MAYCTIEDVAERLPVDETLDDIREPLIDTVETWIDPFTTNPVNVAFRAAGVSLPIALTETDLLGMLKVKCAYRVAFEVMAKRTPATGITGTGATKFYWELWKTEFDKLLKDITEGNVVPSTIGVTRNLPESRTMDAEGSDDETINPYFYRGQKF